MTIRKGISVSANRFWAVVICGALLMPLTTSAGPAIPGFYGSSSSPAPNPPAVGALPVVRDIEQNATLEKTGDASLVVHQTDSKAIINWKSFDIGARAWTHFDQQGNTDWIALNRIYDHNPSQIFGRLTADGRVYLINQNGILFGPGSQVNVHSLIASALNIRDDHFLANLLQFNSENDTGQEYDETDIPLADRRVSNHGDIQTQVNGSVFLLGPHVENDGRIDAPFGQVALAAGTEIHLENIQEYTGSENSTREARLVNVKAGGGTADNFIGAELTADQGVAGMYGGIVNQNGLIRSVTAVKKAGRIELIASDKITLGPESSTLSPISTSTEAVHESFVFTGGEIYIGSHDSARPDLFDNPDMDELRCDRIELYGALAAPAGAVKVNAEDKLYVDDDCTIDVSGSVVALDSQANVIQAQLNSVEMRDDYGQKGGILKGETIAFDAHAGSAVGNVSQHLSSEEQTALERSTEGGTIILTAKSGDLIVKQDAHLDFAGGGTWYNAGRMDFTKLVSGHRVFDISDAPQWIAYDKVLGDHTTVYGRFGIRETFAGVSYGGPASFQEYGAMHFEGGDAGSLELHAARIVLDGELDGRAFAGAYQTLSENPKDEYGEDAARGRVIPNGGALVIGFYDDQGSNEFINRETERIVLKQEVAPAAGMTADSAFYDRYPGKQGLVYASGDPVLTTYLSTELLNSAGLGSIALNANTEIRLETGADIAMASGGLFAATARGIDINSHISAPSGTVTLATQESVTGFSENAFVDMPDLIHLGEHAMISTTGERIDNTLIRSEGAPAAMVGRLDGGTVTMQDQIDANVIGNQVGLVLDDGAVVDVSAGWRIGQDGDITGGDAGELRLQGAMMELEGSLLGLSLAGADGGKLEMKTRYLTFLPAGTNPADVNAPGMILADDRFRNSGFQEYTFAAVDDVLIPAGVGISPSLVKLADPIASAAVFHGAGNLAEQDPPRTAQQESFQTVQVSIDEIGATGIHIQTDAPFERIIDQGDLLQTPAALTMESTASIVLPPEGSITLQAGGIEMAGDLIAPAGNIGLTTTYNNADLNIVPGARISASGYNRPEAESLLAGLPARFTPLAGGEIRLNAGQGNLIVGQDAVLDVSGSEALTQVQAGAEGSLQRTAVAGKPGSLVLSYFEQLSLSSEARLQGNAKLSNLPGGSLTIERSNVSEGLSLVSDGLQPSSGGAVTILPWADPDSGFDDLTLKSGHDITFLESMHLRTPGSITLDAPLLRTEGFTGVTVEAPWVTLQNTAYPFAANREAGVSAGKGVFQVLADWVDLTGDIRITGVVAGSPGVRLHAEQDIRLSDHYYSYESKPTGYEGLLSAPGDITMTASRIYPTTQSDFTISTAGTLTTAYSFQPGTGPGYSTDGQVTVLAQNINHQGALLAPMGRIVLASDLETKTVDGVAVIDYLPAERVFLAPGSLLSTKGTTEVNYGGFDDQAIAWRYMDKSKKEITPTSEIQTAPEKSITIEGREVIVRNDAAIDASGGGSLFGYQFLAGIEGTNNPLEKSGQYVILPDNGVPMPGERIHLSGMNGLAEGDYYLLPDEFAFMPDALVIRDLGVSLNPANASVTEQGYPIVTGQELFYNGGSPSPVVHEYSVRKAADVLQEGNFTKASLESADAADIIINGATTILDGEVSGRPSASDDPEKNDGGRGGLLALSGVNVKVGGGNGATATLGFEDALEPGMRDNLLIGQDTLAGGELGKISLGETGLTKTIEIGADSKIVAGEIVLQADHKIDVAEDVQITAREGAGDVTLVSGAEIRIQTGATVDGENIRLDAHSLSLEGEVRPGESLTMAGDDIYLAADAYAGNVNDLDGLLLRETDWNSFGADTMGLDSRSELFFLGNVNLSVAGALTINAAGIRGREINGNGSARLEAETIHISNGSGTAPAGEDTGNLGSLELKADDRFIVGPGDVRFGGFENITLIGSNELIFQGAGRLDTGNGNLNLETGLVGTAAVQEQIIADGKMLLSSQPADFRIQTGSGDLQILPTNSTNAINAINFSGGNLTFEADTIQISSLVNVDGGRVTAVSHGDGIILAPGGRISARGTDSMPGGRIELQTDNGGSIRIDEGAELDVSAGGQGDAGRVTLSAPVGGVVIAGELSADHGQSGRGGEFSLDTNAIDDIAPLVSKLTDGGFDQVVSLLARNNDVDLSTDITAHEFTLTADAGSIHQTHAIKTAGPNGGKVEMNAAADITLASGARIDARSQADDNDGGLVRLNSTGGTIDLQDGSEVLASGSGSGKDGVVWLRSEQNGAAGPRMNLNGIITGAAEVNVEAVTVKTDQTKIDSALVSDWYSKLGAYMISLNAGGVKTRMLAGLTLRDRADATLSGDEKTARFHLKPGLEVRSKANGSLSLDTDWVLSPAAASADSWRFGGEAGALTLRSAGDLTINGSITDNPSTAAGLSLPAGLDSWDIMLTAGTDLAGADPSAVRTESGNLIIQENRQIYTESGRILFASGGDTILGKNTGNSTTVFPYCLATYSGEIHGEVGRDLKLGGSDIQSGTGDISIAVAGDLTAERSGSGDQLHVGSIRTLGRAPGTGDLAKHYWDYQDGGDIIMDVEGDVAGDFNRKAWDAREQLIDYDTQTVTYLWSPSYKGVSGTQGFAALGGGDVKIHTGGDFLGQGGAFGPGDVRIFSGGDMDGYFLINRGEGLFHANGNFGLNPDYPNQTIELMAATADVNAGGSIYLGTVINPTIAGDIFRKSFATASAEWNLTYTYEGWNDPENPDEENRNSGISLFSRAADVLVSGKQPSGAFNDVQIPNLELILPSDVTITAFRDIRIHNRFVLAPSPTGNCALLAGRDIDARGSINGGLIMSDIDPAIIYGRQSPDVWGENLGQLVLAVKNRLFESESLVAHAETPVHTGDADPVRIQAGNDIVKLKAYLPKKAEITAGHDLVDIGYKGQNLDPSDESRIQAGHDIYFSTETTVDAEKIISSGGPGFLLVSAGNRIDLGASKGIEASGTLWNSALPDTGGALAVVSGYDLYHTEEEFHAFFEALKAPGKEVADKLAQGDITAGQAQATEIQNELIKPFLSPSATAGAGADGRNMQAVSTDASNSKKGDINMVMSQIDTLGSKNDLYIAAAGTMNVGRSTLIQQDSSKQTGIYTASGGRINIYSEGDVNVNESRVMTFFGGDILTWSDGDINAGRGSKTAINLQSAKLVYNTETGAYSAQFQPPAVGSGVRTLTFDPDGEGPAPQPDFGDVYLIAPFGEIDAGEAGIAGRNVFLGARSVVNVQNISFSQGAVGVPSTTESAAGLGALTGGGVLNDATKLADAAGSALEEANKRFEQDAKAMEDTFMPAWLRVEFMGFDVEDGGWTEDDENDKNK